MTKLEHAQKGIYRYADKEKKSYATCVQYYSDISPWSRSCHRCLRLISGFNNHQADEISICFRSLLSLVSFLPQSPMFDGKVPNWYHFMCFFAKQRPKSVGDIDKFGTLRYEDQKRIQEKIGKGLAFYPHMARMSPVEAP